MRLSSTGQTSFNIMRGIMRTLAGWQRRRTRPAARGSSSHNPHYVWRPRVQPRSPCSAKLRWRSALLSAVVPFCGPAVTAIPGGSGAVLRRRHRVAVSQKRLSAWRPPLERTLCPPGVVWLRRLVPRKKAARHSFPPRKPPQPALVRVVMQRQTPVRQWCRRAPFRRLRTLCRPHPQTPRRGPAMPPEAAWRPPVTGCRKRT